ncbi:MAG: glycosyltransferase family 2 protein [Bacteroidaceae bacterium]|nr:glycosyltransferase family 2 protein [Bacteroidaceae bacterium]
MSFKYDISFIAINYNGVVDTCELIQSLKDKVSSVSYEIIITDNASKVEEAAEIHRKHPDVKIIRSEKNLGFAGGNNIAIPQAEGRYLMFINNDTIVEEDHFDCLIKRLESKPEIGMVCPKLRFYWENRPIQFAGFTALSNITLRNASIGFGEDDNGQHDTAHPTPFAHGAAMLTKREVIEKVGMMWEGYFLYYEEMDWSTRITNAGYEIWYEPACTIFHKESKSVGMGSPLKTYYLTRNRLLYAKRNKASFTKLLCYTYLTTVALFIHTPRYALTRHLPHAKSVLRGLKDFYF